jgi:hypothetical protein
MVDIRMEKWELNLALALELRLKKILVHPVSFFPEKKYSPDPHLQSDEGLHSEDQ